LTLFEVALLIFNFKRRRKWSVSDGFQT